MKIMNINYFIKKLNDFMWQKEDILKVQIAVEIKV